MLRTVLEILGGSALIYFIAMTVYWHRMFIEANDELIDTLREQHCNDTDLDQLLHSVMSKEGEDNPLGMHRQPAPADTKEADQLTYQAVADAIKEARDG